jgi:hypothetical protein
MVPQQNLSERSSIIRKNKNKNFDSHIYKKFNRITSPEIKNKNNVVNERHKDFFPVSVNHINTTTTVKYTAVENKKKFCFFVRPVLLLSLTFFLSDLDP